ncbi:MAG: HepT-like ribonuclease domain-containing protein [Campylobacterota bacterium]|nr:HepT-like ribonuclease domain-containing protein [Campylobacterota bacterium]
MYDAKNRLEVIYKKIVFIQNICAKNGSITKALEDEESSRASILMHLTSIAEQFDKLSKDAEFEILSKFDKSDLKGSYDVRNYIAHDYEGINLAIIELIIREKIPKMKFIIEEILGK